MADEPLKNCYRDIEAGEQEMARYRARLAHCLNAAEAPRAASRWMPWIATAVTVAVLLLVVAPFTGTSRVAPRGVGLAELEAMAAITAAEEMLVIAAKELERAMRPEVRYFYLEYLLDHGDEHSYDIERLETLMDRETDRGCQRLYRQLFNLVA